MYHEAMKLKLIERKMYNILSGYKNSNIKDQIHVSDYDEADSNTQVESNGEDSGH